MMTKAEKKTRDSNIRKWFKEGVSQSEIGSRVDLTRQRIQQIEDSIGLSRGDLRVKKEYTVKCQTCKCKFTDTKSSRKYCTRECFRKSRIKTLSQKEQVEREIERKKKNRLKAKNYYHKVFKKRSDWQKLVKERNEKNYAAHTSHKSQTT